MLLSTAAVIVLAVTIPRLHRSLFEREYKVVFQIRFRPKKSVSRLSQPETDSISTETDIFEAYFFDSRKPNLKH